jgi:hypothetical protein
LFIKYVVLRLKSTLLPPEQVLESKQNVQDMFVGGKLIALVILMVKFTPGSKAGKRAKGFVSLGKRSKSGIGFCTFMVYVHFLLASIPVPVLVAIVLTSNVIQRI